MCSMHDFTTQPIVTYTDEEGSRRCPFQYSQIPVPIMRDEIPVLGRNCTETRDNYIHYLVFSVCNQINKINNH